MKVLITGGSGFLGQRLARRILGGGTLVGASGEAEEVDEMVLFDHVPTTAPVARDDRIRIETGDISDRAAVFGLIDRDDICVFHLASVVSGGGEKDFDLAMRVNLDGGRNVLDALRERGGCPRLVFASSIAVFGGAGMDRIVGDRSKQTPQTTYGATKAICELLVNDYTRKGFIDGRSARLPTVIIRPGKPNAAASGFASAVFREPLNGEDYVLPVGPETVMPILGYRSIVEGIVRLHEVDGDRLGDDRAVSLPSLVVSVADMLAALDRVAGDRSLGKIRIEPDAFIETICAGWPRGTKHDRALDIGLPVDESLDEIIGQYIEDYVDGSGS